MVFFLKHKNLKTKNYYNTYFNILYNQHDLVFSFRNSLKVLTILLVKYIT